MKLPNTFKDRKLVRRTLAVAAATVASVAVFGTGSASAMSYGGGYNNNYNNDSYRNVSYSRTVSYSSNEYRQASYHNYNNRYDNRYDDDYSYNNNCDHNRYGYNNNYTNYRRDY